MAPIPPPSCQGRSGKRERNVINGDRRPGNQGKGDDPTRQRKGPALALSTLCGVHTVSTPHTLHILSTLCGVHTVSTLHILSTFCTFCQHFVHPVNTVHTLSTLCTHSVNTFAACTLLTLCTFCQHFVHSVNTLYTLSTLCTLSQHFVHTLSTLFRRAHC